MKKLVRGDWVSIIDSGLEYNRFKIMDIVNGEYILEFDEMPVPFKRNRLSTNIKYKNKNKQNENN